MDTIDKAQAAQMIAVEDALSRLRPRAQGLPQCEMPACDEPISALRQSMGARLCIDCQNQAELRKAQSCARRAV